MPLTGILEEKDLNLEGIGNKNKKADILIQNCWVL